MRISDWSSDVCSSDLTRLLSLFGIEIFDRLEIQQGVDSMGKSRGIEIDHVTAKLSTPFRDHASVPDVQHHQQQGDANHSPTEFQEKTNANHHQLHNRRGDVEQQEVRHDLNALRAPFYDLLTLPG